MRRMIGSTLVSLDGVIGDPQSWANEYFGEEATALALDRLLVSDALLMGPADLRDVRRLVAEGQQPPTRTG